MFSSLSCSQQPGCSRFRYCRTGLYLVKATAIFSLVLGFAAVQPAHAQAPGGGYWLTQPCDAQGNPLTSPLQRNGFYLMDGTKSGTASNTYPPDWVASLGSNPTGGASPLTVTTIPTMPTYNGVGIAGYPTYGSFASNGLGGGIYTYYTSTSSGLINGSVTTHIDGQLVYYFLVQWTGGGTPTVQMPKSISLLLNTNLFANVQLNYGNSKLTSGLSASSSASDKAFNETASSTGPTSVIGYHLVQASVSPLTATTGIAETYLNGTVDQTASDPIPAGEYVSGHGYQPPNGSSPAVANSTMAIADSEVSAGVRPFNIQLVQPDPNTDPTLGMGTANQYVYSADTPDGYLYVPGAIQVVGGTHADAQMLLDNNLVDLKIETSPIPNAFVHQWVISGSTIYVNTPQNTDDPYPGYQFNHWIFKGLPSSFSTVADGNHNVNLYVQGAKTQTAKIQTFFNMKVSNWPIIVVPFVKTVNRPNLRWIMSPCFP